MHKTFIKCIFENVHIHQSQCVTSDTCALGKTYTGSLLFKTWQYPDSHTLTNLMYIEYQIFCISPQQHYHLIHCHQCLISNLLVNALLCFRESLRNLAQKSFRIKLPLPGHSSITSNLPFNSTWIHG
jgi:hypothetical protein